MKMIKNLQRIMTLLNGELLENITEYYYLII